MDNIRYIMFKLPIRELIAQDFDVFMDDDYAISKGYLIAQGPSLLFDQIEMLRGHFSSRINEFVLVEAKKNPKLQDALVKILDEGFTLNGIHYNRFGKSAAQGKAGITAFVSDDIFDELYRITQMDITIDECVISKYEAQRSLVFSNCTLVRNYIPHIVIIGEYEKVIPHQLVRYVVQKKKDIIDRETGEPKTISVREIEEGYHDINLSPFDGSGCHEKEFMEHVSDALGLDYQPIGNQIRMPGIKGYSTYVPFREIFHEWGISEITDIYGHVHNIDDVDCIWNTSMFKWHKLFKQKYGNDAWNGYMDTFKKYNFKLGISKYSHHIKDIDVMARLNFQYLQCLDLWNAKYIDHFMSDKSSHKEYYDVLDPNNKGKIIEMAEYSTNLFEKVIKGDKFYTYKFLGIKDTDDYDPDFRYLEAALINDVMLRDVALKQYLHRKLRKKINEMKIGKIYVEGFYHTLTCDMIGYLQYAAGMEPIGCLKAKEFYCDTIGFGKAMSFRSPLVCPSEVNDITIVHNDVIDKWFQYFKDQDVVMVNMYDISLPQQGGADLDGDAVLLTNNKIILDSKIAKPIIVDIEDKVTTGNKPYTKENIIQYELMTRDNRIGEITNVATSIRNKYSTDEEFNKRCDDNVSLLRIFQGKEIDFLKTGVRWQMNKSLRNYLKQLPFFLLHNYPKKLATYYKIKQKNKSIDDPKEKSPLNAYRSPSPMNELCEYITSWEKRHILWDSDICDTRCVTLDNSLDLNDRKIMRDIKHVLNDFATEWRTLMDIIDSDNSDAGFQIDILINKYKKLLSIIVPDEKLLANYVIKVSYANQSMNKVMCWRGYGEYLIQNLKKNTPRQKRTIIEEVPYAANAYEYLGKYYKMTEESYE